MPLLRFDLVEGRSPAELAALLDAAHRAVVTAFKVPIHDRYQIVHEHPPARLIIEDTGLGIERTADIVVVSVTSRPRSAASKQEFYAELCRELKNSCFIEPSDVVVSITTNADEDWSFGDGRAQFVTGEL